MSAARNDSPENTSAPEGAVVRRQRFGTKCGKFTIERDGDQITLRGQHHTWVRPASELPAWLAFYRKMKEKYGNRSEGYEKCLKLLAAVQ